MPDKHIHSDAAAQMLKHLVNVFKHVEFTEEQMNAWFNWFLTIDAKDSDLVRIAIDEHYGRPKFEVSVLRNAILDKIRNARGIGEWNNFKTTTARAMARLYPELCQCAESELLVRNYLGQLRRVIDFNRAVAQARGRPLIESERKSIFDMREQQLRLAIQDLMSLGLDRFAAESLAKPIGEEADAALAEPAKSLGAV